MANDDRDDLDDAFAALRGDRAPGADLLDRIAGDARAEAAMIEGLAGLRDAARPSDLLMARIARDARAMRPRRRLGEAAMWGGLVAAGMAGVMIGATDPGGLIETVLPAAQAYALDDLGPSYDFQFTTGE